MLFLSPAKINVHLGIGGKRPDGYHNICSWFLKVSLYDSIYVNLQPASTSVVIEGNAGVPVKADLMFKAAELFYEESGISGRCIIRIDKKIPIGAGLGGGSSNAATVLMALNHLHGAVLPVDRLYELCSRLGSDVPFFLGGPSAVVSGRGEILREIYPKRSWWVLLVDPGFPISTREAYCWFDTEIEAQQELHPDAEDLRLLIEGPTEKWRFFNAFSPVLYRRYPVLERICAGLASGGAVHAAVSGSGSACFGLFETHAGAVKAVSKFSGMRFWLKETLAG
ncbi:MAG: 4-(cytidine 5'-diphospho)-2-C-methyl-D-erythritol kinase [Spirochaetales bacterium]|nr:4-(cytidine 5'-diphospho)-2-C-methyl-D-erythritol kinase [Spirochaetales bacterium]